MSMRYQAAIMKPGFNPLGAQTIVYNLFTWGQNTNGPLGLGNTTNYSSPKQVGTNGWTKVAGGRFHSVAVRSDGTLWAWGANARCQLGLGNLTNYSSPKQVGALTNWGYFSNNGYLSIGAVNIKTNGTLWVWGGNSAGELGLGNRTNYSSPKQVGLLTTWQKVSMATSVLAVK